MLPRFCVGANVPSIRRRRSALMERQTRGTILFEDRKSVNVTTAPQVARTTQIELIFRRSEEESGMSVGIEHRVNTVIERTDEATRARSSFACRHPSAQSLAAGSKTQMPFFRPPTAPSNR